VSSEVKKKLLLGKQTSCPEQNHSALSYRIQHLTEARNLALSKKVERPLISKFKGIFMLLFILVDRILKKSPSILTYRN